MCPKPLSHLEEAYSGARGYFPDARRHSTGLSPPRAISSPEDPRHAGRSANGVPQLKRIERVKKNTLDAASLLRGEHEAVPEFVSYPRAPPADPAPEGKVTFGMAGRAEIGERRAQL